MLPSGSHQAPLYPLGPASVPEASLAWTSPPRDDVGATALAPLLYIGQMPFGNHHGNSVTEHTMATDTAWAERRMRGGSFSCCTPHPQETPLNLPARDEKPGYEPLAQGLVTRCLSNVLNLGRGDVLAQAKAVLAQAKTVAIAGGALT